MTIVTGPLLVPPPDPLRLLRSADDALVATGVRGGAGTVVTAPPGARIDH
ncbi:MULTISPECIES: hypothetical protein [Streptomyces]